MSPPRPVSNTSTPRDASAASVARMWERPPSPRTPSVRTCGCSTRSRTSPTRPSRRSSTSCRCSASASAYGTTPSRRTSGALLIPVLERAFHLRHELVRDGTVDDAVIEPERQDGGDARHDCVVHDEWPFFDGADAQDGNLRLIDDRRARQCAKRAWVRDGKGAANDVVRRQMFAARTGGQVGDALRDSSK